MSGLVQHVDGGIVISTRYGEFLLKRGTFEFAYREVIIRLLQSIRGGQAGKFREYRYLVSNRFAKLFMAFEDAPGLARGLAATQSGWGSDNHLFEGGEKRRVRELIIEDLHLMWMLTDWSRMNKQQRGEAEERLGKLEAALRPVINDHKRAMHRLIARVRDLRDSRGQINIAVVQNRLQHAAPHGEFRLEEIDAMIPWIGGRQAWVSGLIRDYASQIYAAHDKLRRVWNALGELGDVEAAPEWLLAEIVEVGQVMTAAKDRPWLRSFRRNAEDLRTAYRFGLPQRSRDQRGYQDPREAQRRVGYAMASLENAMFLLELISYFGPISLEYHRGRERRPTRLAHLMADIETLRDALPVKRLANGAILPGADADFALSVSHRFWEELDDALLAHQRGNSDEMMMHLRNPIKFV